jgi:glycosyltransferase involved in cell wall biosynthesis
MVNSLSLIVTTYNSSEFIVELAGCLKKLSSYLSQIVIIDDCSNDGCLEALRASLEGVPCAVVCARTSENSGRPSKPRNLGLSIAQSDWLIFLDADDLIPAEYVEYLSSMPLDSNAIYSLNRKKVPRPAMVEYGHRPRFLRLPGALLRYKNVVCFSGSAVSRAVVGVSQFPDSYLEDWLFFREIAQKHGLYIQRAINLSTQYRNSVASLTPNKLTQLERVSTVGGGLSLLPYFFVTVLLLASEKIVGLLERDSRVVTVVKDSSDIRREL